jgi:hypothetical protein
MLVTGISVVFVDVPRDREAEFNRWYDLDHLPEMCARPDVLTARRYYADDSTLKYRFDKLENAPPIGPARFCTMYLYRGDFADLKERNAEFRQRIPAERRLPSYAKATYIAVQRLVSAHAAPRIRVSAEARPYLGHRALQLAIGHSSDAAHAAEVAAWWDSTQYPQMLSVPGWAAVLRCEPVGEEGKGKFMHLFLLDAPAAEAHEAMEKKLRELRTSGSSMHPRYTRIFSGPFSAITPLDYAATR